MAFRFWRRIKVAPGVTLNVSKRGASVSFGPRGAKLTVGTRGTRATVGIPGTGLFYTMKLSEANTKRGREGASRVLSEDPNPEWASGTAWVGAAAPTQAEAETATPAGAAAGHYLPADGADSAPRGPLAAAAEAAAANPTPPAPGAAAGPPLILASDQLPPGFCDEIPTSKEEQALIDGCRQLALGNEQAALAQFKDSVHLADAAYLAGILALRSERFDEAGAYLTLALEKEATLGQTLAKYGMTAVMSLSITDDICVHVGPDARGVLLALTEIYQRTNRPRGAIRCLERLQQLEPDDLVVKLSLAELLLSTVPENERQDAQPQDDEGNLLQRVVKLGAGVGNETPLHTALLLYKAKALHRLGLLDAARATLAVALSSEEGRPKELVRALRLERALVYRDLGNSRRARIELEKLYAECPDDEEVAAHLGLAPPDSDSGSHLENPSDAGRY